MAPGHDLYVYDLVSPDGVVTVTLGQGLQYEPEFTYSFKPHDEQPPEFDQIHFGLFLHNDGSVSLEQESSTAPAIHTTS